MGWTVEEFGDAHSGYAGAVLADGSEPKPVYFDIGSGASMPSTLEWWAYSGQYGRPTAVGFRGACSCGWRGPAHPIDWPALNAAGVDLMDADTAAASDDWDGHIEAVERQTVPLPDDVSDLIDRLRSRLDTLADDHPAAALRAAAAIERLAADTGRAAAFGIDVDPDADADWAEDLARDLGTSPSQARSRLRRYALGL